MNKLTIMKGLPACGKSTKAEELVRERGNTVRINKDLIRTMLHFDKFTGKNEGLTREVARTLASHFLTTGINVIIDDTNLNPSTMQSWLDLGKLHDVKIEVVDMTHVPVDVCIERDLTREKKVGRQVIQKMAMQYVNYLKDEDVVICDLDGTLCDVEHRRHFVQKSPKDWKGFFAGIKDDPVKLDVLNSILNHEEKGTKIILVSARPEQYREATEKWLYDVAKGYPFYDVLIMREDHDSRPDTMTKNDIYEKYLKQMNILKVYDDRPSVIRMWQEKGLDVVNCGNGEEF